MKQHTPKHYNTFLCLADNCPDTCCAGWDVVIDEKSQECYRNTPGAFGERLKHHMQKDEDGDVVFKAAGGHCPFLSATNLCQIYSTLGESALCKTCRLYPRFFNDYGIFQEAGLALSCPEAARLILEDPTPATFNVTDEIAAYTSEVCLDAKLLHRLFNARKTSIMLLQNPTLSYHQRLALLLDFNIHLTSGLFMSDHNQEQCLCAQYENNETLLVRLQALKSKAQASNDDLLITILQLLKDCEHRTTAFTSQIDAAIAFLADKAPLSAPALWPAGSTQSHYAEHTGVYMLYRYFLESVFTYEPLIQAQHTALATIATALLTAATQYQVGCALTPKDHQKIIIAYSREIEHSIFNMEYIEDQLMTDKRLSPECWIRFLLWE